MEKNYKINMLTTAMEVIVNGIKEKPDMPQEAIKCFLEEILKQSKGE